MLVCMKLKREKNSPQGGGSGGGLIGARNAAQCRGVGVRKNSSGLSFVL